MNKISQAIGIGRRKTSVAKAFIKKGTGILTINDLSFEKYFSLNLDQKNYILEAILLFKLENKLNFSIKVIGGGKSSQLDAIKLALSKALSNYDINKYHTVLAKKNLLFSDSRVKERRKYGLKKARKAAQYHKR